MKLTDNTDKINYYLHWLRVGQPVDVSTMTDLTLDYLFRRMPELADEGVLHRVPFARQRVDDPYAIYENGPGSCLVLRDRFGIPLNRTRFRETSIDPVTRKAVNVKWITERLFTTKVVVPIWTSLGARFTPKYVEHFKVDVAYNHQRKKIGITPDFDFDITLGTRSLLHRVEADNAGKDDETGVMYKSEPLAPSDWLREAPLRKVLGYLAALRAGKKFVVLFVCRSHRRATNFHEIIYPLVADHGGEEFRKYFKINYLQCLKNDPLGSWTNLMGESASLLPEGT